MGETSTRPVAEGPRERRRRLTASEVERVAIELFSERGFDEVTVDEIAVAAGISRRTFFRYYPSKEDVVLAVGDKQLEMLRSGLAARPAEEPVLAALRNTLLVMAGGFEIGREEYLRRWEIVTACPTLGARAYGLQWDWDETISDYVARRLGVDPDEDLRPRVIGGAIMGALRAATASWILGPEADLSDLLGEAFDLMIDGLGSLVDGE